MLQRLSLEIANWIGAAKEIVIREIAEFKIENLISKDENYFYVTDYHKLKKLAGLVN